MANTVEAFQHYWLRRLLWVTLGLLLFLLPASPMLFVLQALYDDNPQKRALPSVQRLVRRLAEVASGSVPPR